MAPARSTPPRIVSGETYLPDRIGLTPEHLHDGAPFHDGVAVLMRRTPEGVSEVVDDLNGNLLAFFRVLLSSPGGGHQNQTEQEPRP